MLHLLKRKALYVSSDVEGFRGQIYANIFENHNQYLYLKYLRSWNYHHHLVFWSQLGSLPFSCSDILNCMFLRAGSALSRLSCEVPKWPLTPKRTKKTWCPVYWCYTVYRNGHFFCGHCLLQCLIPVHVGGLPVEMPVCLHYNLVVAVMAHGLCLWFTTLHFCLLIRLVTHWNAPLQKLLFPFSGSLKT